MRHRWRYTFEVAYGRHDAEAIRAANECARCRGKGSATTCPLCHGTGQSGRAGYAYAISSESAYGCPLDVGAIVLVPGNWRVPGPQEATVVRIGTSYDGEIAKILGVVDPDTS
jgi:hypothetical protein